MSDLKQRIDGLAALMEEFRLIEAEYEVDGQRIAFRRKLERPPAAVSSEPAHGDDEVFDFAVQSDFPLAQAGIPVSSPMTGIYYGAPNPNAPPFVREGEPVTAGQVVGLIEAMKVFNEIVATTSGTVLKVVAESGALVQPGEPLLYIG